MSHLRIRWFRSELVMITLDSVVVPAFFIPSSYFTVSPADTPLIKSLSTKVSRTEIDSFCFVTRDTVAASVLVIGFPNGGMPLTLIEVLKKSARDGRRFIRNLYTCRAKQLLWFQSKGFIVLSFQNSKIRRFQNSKIRRFKKGIFQDKEPSCFGFKTIPCRDFKATYCLYFKTNIYRALTSTLIQNKYFIVHWFQTKEFTRDLNSKQGFIALRVQAGHKELCIIHGRHKRIFHCTSRIFGMHMVEELLSCICSWQTSWLHV